MPHVELPVDPSPPAAYRVRSASYPCDRVKQRPGPADLELTRVVLGTEPLPPDNSAGGPRVLQMRFLCPRGLCFTIEMADTGAESPLLERFMEGDDDFCRRRLKLLPVCTKGPWLVRATIGRPAILASAVPTTFERAGNSLVVTVDVASSKIACGIFGTVTRALKGMVLDLGLVIEATDKDDLPEHLLGGCRIDRVDFSAAAGEAAAGEC